jgi:hypothetical protein
VSGRSVVVFGEGPHELGNVLDQRLSSGQLPALPQLVHRLLDRPSSVGYTCRNFKDVRAVHKRGHKFARKVIRAVRQARRDGFTAAAIVIDRDRRRDNERIGALRDGRDAVSALEYPPCAVGAAVEAFDAWMIADGKAIGEAGGVADRSHPDPESLDGKEGKGKHPKDVAAKIFGGKHNLPQKYPVVASNVDLSFLEKACPKGFKPFAEEVRERLSPVVCS